MLTLSGRQALLIVRLKAVEWSFSTAQYMIAVQLQWKNLDHTSMNFSGSQWVMLRNASVLFKDNTHANVQFIAFASKKQGVSKCPTHSCSIGKPFHGFQPLWWGWVIYTLIAVSITTIVCKYRHSKPVHLCIVSVGNAPYPYITTNITGEPTCRFEYKGSSYPSLRFIQVSTANRPTFPFKR